MTRLSIWLVTAKAMRDGKVGLDQAGDDVHRRALGGDDQVDADGTRHLRQAADVLLHLFGRGHHQVGHLVHDHHDEGQVLLVAFGQVLVVAGQIACADFAQEGVAPLHLFDGPEENARRLVHFGDNRRQQMGNAVVDAQLDHLRIDHQHAQACPACGSAAAR